MVEKKENNKISKEDIYKTIEELSKKGTTKSKIGLELKKNKVLKTKKETGKKIGQIQKELKIKENEIPEDLMALIKKAVKLLKHRADNKKDNTSKRGYQLTVAKINRLKKYYIKKGKLPNTWRYTEEKAKLLVK
jgi:small subunit ribosomal protein S15